MKYSYLGHIKKMMKK